MNKIATLVENIPHRTKGGEAFIIRLKKRNLSVDHNYWLYFIEADHESWPTVGFYVFVTKQAFPRETDADRLAQTLALDESKARLEDAGPDGRPILAPFLVEGWGIF